MAKKLIKNCATNIAHFRKDCDNSEQSMPIESATPFIGAEQISIEKLHKYRRQKSLSPCLELLEKLGVTGDTAIFVLSRIGGKG